MAAPPSALLNISVSKFCIDWVNIGSVLRHFVDHQANIMPSSTVWVPPTPSNGYMRCAPSLINITLSVNSIEQCKQFGKLGLSVCSLAIAFRWVACSTVSLGARIGSSPPRTISMKSLDPLFASCRWLSAITYIADNAVHQIMPISFTQFSNSDR